MFSPSCSTIHAVKADYNHLLGQRTQLYGNLWYKEITTLKRLEWESLDLINDQKQSKKASDLNPLLNITSKAISKIKRSFSKEDHSNYLKIERQPDEYK